MTTRCTSTSSGSGSGRSATNNDEKDDPKQEEETEEEDVVRAYLESVGVMVNDELSSNKGVQEKMVRALEQAGSCRFSTPQDAVRALQSFGPVGCQALATSILQQDAAESSSSSHQNNHHTDKNKPRVKGMVTIHVPHHNATFDVEVTEGQTLMDVALQHYDLLGEYITCACGGMSSCATCHVILDHANENNVPNNLLPPPSEAELDMLDLIPNITPTSRLGCQITFTRDILTKPTHKISIILPEEVQDFWS
uniref:2Fe-2S ferredoxin-type domain-containing protein n=1 Tax=Attheya septentrionalis TaxID=420275 RepID=A0A7S2UPM0_9STRA